MNAPVRHVPKYAPYASALARQADFQGSLKVAVLPRLVECLADNAGELQVALSLRPAIAGPAHLRGYISGGITLVCQRCLRPYVQAMRVDVDLRPVRSEAEESKLLQVPDADPYLISDDRLPLHELIEDELLLALPMAPYCEQADCIAGPSGAASLN